MFIASTLFNAVHPGKVMPGKGGDIPSRKERKMAVERESGGSAILMAERGEVSE